MAVRSPAQLGRQVLGKVFPKSLYLALARAYGRSASRRQIGAAEYKRLQHLANAPLGGEPESFEAPGLPAPVWVRPGTTDALVFEGNILRQTYDCFTPTSPPKLIVDAGVNVGYASGFLLNKFPTARVIGLEPDGGNFNMAKRNLEVFGNRVDLRQLGLWSRPAKLKVTVGDRADGIQVHEAEDNSAFDCEGIDLLTLLNESPEDRIDIFKCDIEGAERYIFEADCDPWLQKTDLIAIEVHDQPSHDAVYGAMARNGFSTYRHRELHIFHR